MCVIAQTPLISPFGSIGFREREREQAREKVGGGIGGGEEEEDGGGGATADRKRNIFRKYGELQLKYWILITNIILWTIKNKSAF